MPDYQFSAIKIVPQSASKEPVAVGVILYDPKKGEISADGKFGNLKSGI